MIQQRQNSKTATLCQGDNLQVKKKFSTGLSNVPRSKNGPLRVA